MDFLKIIDWASNYLAEYFAVLFSTLQNPEPAYKPDKEQKKNINPKLMGFALISIAIGSTINSVIPNRPAVGEIFTTSIITLIMWIVYSMVIFLASTLLRGKVHILEVTTVSLQLFGTVYVISNLAAFLWGFASLNPIIYQLVSNIDTFKFVADNPSIIFYFVQITILTIYLPKALEILYGSDNGRIVLITVVSVLFIFSCGISPYISILLNTTSQEYASSNSLLDLVISGQATNTPIDAPQLSPTPLAETAEAITGQSTNTLAPLIDSPRLTETPAPLSANDIIATLVDELMDELTATPGNVEILKTIHYFVLPQPRPTETPIPFAAPTNTPNPLLAPTNTSNPFAAPTNTPLSAPSPTPTKSKK